MKPLHGLNKNEQELFSKWINEDEKKYLDRANKFFDRNFNTPKAAEPNLVPTQDNSSSNWTNRKQKNKEKINLIGTTLGNSFSIAGSGKRFSLS